MEGETAPADPHAGDVAPTHPHAGDVPLARSGVPAWWYAAAAAAVLVGCLAVVLLSPDLHRRVNVARATAARAGVAAALAADPRFVDVRPSVDRGGRGGRGGLLVSGTVTRRTDLNALLPVVGRSAGTVPTVVDVIVAEEAFAGARLTTAPAR